jgi:AcrR family transcriptional regulator
MAAPRPADVRPNARRAEIYRTAAAIIRERGFAGTSVNDIARALGMTKAGLYHYISGKEALLFEIMNFGMERVDAEVVRPVKGVRDPADRLRQLLVRHARIATRARGAVSLVMEETRALPPPLRKKIMRRMRAYFDVVRDTLKELEAAGQLQDVDPTVAAFSLFGTIHWLPRWFRPGGRLTVEDAADEIAKVALHGILRSRSSRQSGPAKAKTRKYR